MTPIKTPQKWLAPMVGICALNAAISIALGAALYLNVLPVQLLWLGLGLSALSVLSNAVMLAWMKHAIAAPLKRHETRLSHALAHGLKVDAFEGPDGSLSGLESALDHHACAMRTAFIEVSAADLSDGRAAIHLRFNGDAAARLEQLAASVEASDAWLRRRQDTLIGLHTNVAEQAAAATQTLKDLSDKDRQQQLQMDTFLAGAPDALAQMQRQISLWNEIDPRSFSSIQAQLSGSASDLKATLSTLQQSCVSVTGTARGLSVAAERSQSAVTDLNSAAGTALSDVEAFTGILAKAGEEARAAAHKLSILAKGGKTGLLRGLKGISQSNQELTDTAQALAKHAEDLTACSAEFVDAAALDRGEMRAAVDGLSCVATLAVEKLHSDMQGAIERNQTELVEAAAAVKDEARGALDAGMAEILGASRTYAGALTKEMATLDEQSALLTDARTAAVAVNTMLTQLEGQASQSQSALEAMLAAQEAAMAPLEKVKERATAPLEALLKVDSGHIGKVIQDMETAAQNLSMLEDMQAAPKLTTLQDQLAAMEASLANGFEAQFQSHSQAISATQTAVDAVARRLPDTDTSAAVLAQLLETEQSVLQRIETLQTSIADDQTGAAHAAGKSTLTALRAQLRQLGEQIRGQNDVLRSSLKDMRTSQLQPLKRSVRDLPEAVAQYVLPAFESTAQSLQQAFESMALLQPPVAEPQSPQEPDINDAAASLSTRLGHALAAMDAIETELTSLATAALAAPDAAGSSDALTQTMQEAQTVLSAWSGKLDNISTAIAMAQDAA